MASCSICGDETKTGFRAAVTRQLSPEGPTCGEFLRTVLKLSSHLSNVVCRTCFRRAETLHAKLSEFVRIYEEGAGVQQQQTTGDVDTEGAAGESKVVVAAAVAESVQCIIELSSWERCSITLKRKEAVALISKKADAVVKEFWKDDSLRDEMLCQVYSSIRAECEALCSKSSFLESDVNKLASITFDTARRELGEKAPITWNLLSGIATATRLRRVDSGAAEDARDKSIVIAAATLLKTRNVRACAFQLKIGLALKHFGLSTRGIDILSSLNLSVHHKTLVQKRNDLEVNYARKVNEWKLNVEHQVAAGSRPTHLYGLVGDNFDLVGKVQGEHHQRHWFNSMAIKERPVDESLSRDHRVVHLSTAPLALFLPTIHDLRQLAPSFLALWERTIVKRIPQFSGMQDRVDWHLEHKYSSSASDPSDYDMLGLITKNESVTTDMMEILENLQAFVPNTPITPPLPIYLHGDQKTEKVAISAALSRFDGPTPESRLELLSPVFGLFHLRMNLVKLHLQDFHKRDSVTSLGSSAYLSQRFNHTNMDKDATNYFYEVSSMIEFYTQCQIVAATLVELGCASVSDVPAATAALFENCGNDDDRAVVFHAFSKRCVDRFLNPTALHNLMASDPFAQSADPISCKLCGAYLSFDTDIGHCCGSDRTATDGILNYAKQSLFRGMMLSVLEDAIRENDGDRIELLAKLFLPLLHQRGHDNYAHTVLRLLVFTKVVASTYERDRLLFNMTCNWRRQRGHCTPIDWRLERCNDFLKVDLKSLGANLTEATAVRMSRTLKAIMELVDDLEAELAVGRRSKYHQHQMPLVDLTKVVNLFLSQECRLFMFVEGRPAYKCFKYGSGSVFEHVDRNKTAKWLKESLKFFDTRRSVHSRNVL